MSAILRRGRNIGQLVGECRALIRELYADGGATVATPIDGSAGSPEEGALIVARTVIQPDGDVVCFATYRYCLDPGLRAAHERNVTEWYARAESTLSDLVSVVRSLIGALAVLSSLLIGGLGSSLTSVAFWALLPALVPVTFAGFGAVVRREVRRRVNAALGRR